MAIKKITELDALTSLTDDDLFAVVDNPSGSPVTKKITWENIVAAIGAITALTGDVTATGPGSSAATIANKAVTLAKMADMATASLLGRNTAGSGTPEVLDAATVRSILGLREKLTANRTYYVRKDGNDNNTGLVDSAAGAFLTIQKAVDTIANTLDIAGKIVTVQIGDGTYEENVVLKNVVGYAVPGNLVIAGNSSTPTNVVIAPSSGTAIYSGDLYTAWDIKYLKVSGGIGLYAAYGSTIRYMSVDFGTCYNYHIVSSTAFIRCIGNYTISGNSSRHLWISNGSYECLSRTITVTADITFTTFADARNIGHCNHSGCTFSLGGHTVTGKRYYGVILSSINTNGGGANYFPGDSAGDVDPTSVYT